MDNQVRMRIYHLNMWLGGYVQVREASKWVGWSRPSMPEAGRARVGCDMVCSFFPVVLCESRTDEPDREAHLQVKISAQADLPQHLSLWPQNVQPFSQEIVSLPSFKISRQGCSPSLYDALINVGRCFFLGLHRKRSGKSMLPGSFLSSITNHGLGRSDTAMICRNCRCPMPGKVLLLSNEVQGAL